MAVQKIEIRPKGTGDYGDVLYPKTSADMVIDEVSGNTVASHMTDYVKHPAYATTTGTANTYAVALNPAPTAYVDGMGIVAKINVASTGASTLNVNGLGAKAIKDSLGNAITSGGLKANTPYTLRYETVSGNFIVQGKGGGGNLQPNQALVGFTFTNDSGEQVGIGDPDLIAANIIPGKNIFSVDGAAVMGKKFASGSFPSGLTTDATGAYISPTLDFTPKTIIVRYRQTSNVYRRQAVYSVESLYSTYDPSFSNKALQYDDAGAGTVITTSGFTINASGFVFKPSSSSMSLQYLYWVANE
jgi:hypothetical protein